MNWSLKHTNIAIVGSLGVLFIHVLLFPQFIMSLPILAIGIAIILFFYTALNFYNRSWGNIKNFELKLFTHSLVFRLISIAGMHWITSLYNPESLPLEIGAADSWNYMLSGEMVADAIKHDRSVFRTLSYFWKGESDYGFSIYIGTIYYIFGNSVLVIKILNAILGALTALKIYQITKMLYPEKTARTAGILIMLMPPLLWFTGMLLKETLLIFILVSICKLVINLSQNPKDIKLNLFLIMLYISSLFYFRVFLAPLAIISSILHFSFFTKQKLRYRLITMFIGLLLSVGSYLIVMKLGMADSVTTLIEDSKGQFLNELTSSAEQRGVSYKIAIIAPLIIVGSIVTPLPSLLHFDDGQIGIYAHFQNELIRNFMYFFLFIGIINFIKNNNRAGLYVFLFSMGYSIIMVSSGTSFQDRFQLLSLPFLIIFMADGINSSARNKEKKWSVYLFFIFLAILSWNFFKLAIREIV